MAKNTSLYSNRFYIIEVISYFLLLVPWTLGFLDKNTLGDGSFSLTVNITLSTVVALFIVLLRDVRQKINSLDMLKQGLAQATIHDLKSPLSSIIGALSIFSEPEMGPKKKEELLNVAINNSKSLEKLVQVLLDTERMEIDEMNLHKQHVQLPQLMKECTERFGSLSADKGITLILSVDEQIPTLYADRDLLRRIFENLLLNAIKYSDRGGHISIEAYYETKMFHFEVKDTGIGMSYEHLEKVFEKFYRVSPMEKGSRKGNGLGLYFCRLAVEAHDGKIALNSTIGKGTKVFFEIPQKHPATSFPWLSARRRH